VSVISGLQKTNFDLASTTVVDLDLQRLRMALDSFPRGLSMFDSQQTLVFSNQYYRDLYRIPEELAHPGTPLRAIIENYNARENIAANLDGQEHVQAWLGSIQSKLNTHETVTYIQHLACGRIVEVCISRLDDGGWVDIQEDITHQSKVQQKIAWLAHHDSLTELPNRAAFNERFAQALTEIGAGRGVAVHWLDLDGFKAINDTLGHHVGDALLQSVSRRLQKSLRGHDFVGRLGGDEFALVQLGVNAPDQAIGFAMRIIDNVNAPHEILGIEVSVGASIGIALAPDHGRDPTALLQMADVALYKAKEGGRGRCQLFRKSDWANS
jgi:diguanylate cyclase (GGDEF)-like protein